MVSESHASLPLPAVAIGFRPEFLDFRRGIRVGNLEDHERITRILKLALEARYRQAFVTERWGRGVFWQWIGYLPRANRAAKPLSSHVSFGCAKFFLSVDTDERVFKCGLQVERGYVRAPRASGQGRLQSDWDWHRLLKSLKPQSAIERELKRLVQREGFQIWAGSYEDESETYTQENFPSMQRLRITLLEAPGNHWAGFQLYYPMTEEEVRGSTGVDLVESMVAVFDEVTPTMNRCMQVRLSRESKVES
ncbi:MAG: hypothetical protein LAP13_00165 [Acidobacteriia bacterium]|nr:hypothetical protein [Terriglobia bacterium]